VSEPAAGPPRPPRFFPIAASFYLALAVTGVVGLGLARGRLGPELLADPGAWWVDLGLGVGAGVALLALWELIRRLAAGARRVEVELAALIGELSPGEAAAIALVSAISEEIAFRGAFQEWIGWVPSALLFGLLHLGPGKHYRWWTLWSLAGGLGLGLMVDQRGSLGAAILAHVIVNGVQLQRLRRPGAGPPPDEPASPRPEGEPGTVEPEAPGDVGTEGSPPPDEPDRSARLFSRSRGRENTEMTTETQDVFARIEREKDSYLAELFDYLRIPSISTDPDYRAEVDRCADWLIERLGEAGLETEKIATAGHPLVYAEWNGAGAQAPTVLFYGHYDVQPPDPLDLWRNPPFEPTLEGEQIVARGATDDKGQSYAHVKAVAAMLAERGRLPVNVKFIVEGEEESGGESIEKFVRACRRSPTA